MCSLLHTDDTVVLLHGAGGEFTAAHRRYSRVVARCRGVHCCTQTIQSCCCTVQGSLLLHIDDTVVLFHGAGVFTAAHDDTAVLLHGAGEFTAAHRRYSRVVSRCRDVHCCTQTIQSCCFTLQRSSLLHTDDTAVLLHGAGVNN